MSSYTCLKIRSHTTKCGPSHTITCTCHFEVDAPYRRILTLTLTLHQHSNSTQNQPSSRKRWGQCQLTRCRLKIHTSPLHASKTLAIKYQTSQMILMIFPKWTWSALFELPLAKNFDMPRP